MRTYSPTMGDSTPPNGPQRFFITGRKDGDPMEITVSSKKNNTCTCNHHKEHKPRFEREIIDTEVDEGDIVVFDAQYKCCPAADVRWFKEDEEVELSNRCRVYTYRENSMLVLCDVTNDDTGEYTASITNSMGRIYTVAKLNVYMKEDRWIRLQDKAKARTQDLETAISSLSDFEQAYNRLKTWLGEKDKMMGVLGPIGVEPGILRNQKQQVEVLQDEFRAHDPQMEQFLEAGKALLDKQDPHGRNQSPVQQQLGEVKDMWDDLKNKLDDRQDKIDNILDESEKFHNALQDNSDWLIDFGNRISSLAPISSNPDGVRQQMDETKALQREADRKKSPIETMAESHQQLSALNPELTAKAEVTLKLDSVRSPYQDLCRKLDERQGKLQAALLQSKDFEDSYANMLQWLDAKERELGAAKPISAKPEVLRRQLIEQEEIPKEIVKQVYTYDRMLDKLKHLTDEAPRGSEKDSLQRQHNALEDKWEGVNRRSVDRLERLQDCNNNAKQYTDELNQFLPWLRSAEDRLASLGPVTMKPNVVKRQLEIIKQLQDDIDNHRDHHQAVKQTADQLINSTDVDHPYVRDQVEDANKRWEALQKDVSNQLATLENVAERLDDFQDRANQSQNSLANIEEKLASHDGTKDPRNLDKLKMLANEVAILEDTIVAVKDNSGDLMAAAPSQADTSQINDEVDGMVRRFEKLKNLVGDRYNALEAGSQEVGSFQGMLNDIKSNLDQSEDILDGFDPVARDLNTLDAQTNEIQRHQDHLENIKGDLMKAERVFREIFDKGYLSDSEGFRDQMDNLNKRWSKLRDRANTRQADIDKATGKLHDLDRLLQEVNEGLDKAERQRDNMKPVGADVDTVKQQQKEFKAYVRNFIDPLVPRIRESNRLGQNLIQSADSRVNTSVLENDMETMNDRWNKLNAKNSDREAKLNEGLLRCGKFQEALSSLMSWIGETEELVSHQKDPSSDYKVVKAQLSEQQLLDRLITDREPSVEALKEMGEQLSRVSEPQDRNRIQQQLSDLESRWLALKDAVRDRRRKLEQTAENAKDFQSQIAPLTEWMDKIEHKLSAVEPISTERGQIQKQIAEQQQMHAGIQDKRPAIRKVDNDGQELLKQCTGKEIIDVQQKLDSIQNRYDNIQHKSEDRLHQLEQAVPLATDFDRLQREFAQWLDQAERELRNFDPTDSTDKQKAIQEKLQSAIDSHRPMLGELNEKGTKLIELSPGQGAADIRQQLTDANERYGELSSQVKDIEYRLSAMLEGAQKVEQSVDELLASLNDAERQLDGINRETISVDPNGVREQLKKAKAIDRDINSKTGRMQDTVGAAEKVLEQMADPRQRARLDQRLGQLKDKHDSLSGASSDRVETLEEALPLTLQFNESHEELSRWLNDAENEMRLNKEPGLNAEEIKKEVDKNRFMKQSVAEKQAHVDKLNKIGPELAKLSPGAGARSVEGKLDEDNKRYNNVKDEVNKRGDDMFDRLQRTSSFIEDLDSNLENLNITAEKLARPDPISSDPEVLKKQIKKLQALQDEVEGQMDTVDTMRKAGNDMISQSSPGDPYVRDLRDKLEQLGNKWDNIVHSANEKAGELRETLHAATSFWEELGGTTQTIKDLHEQIRAQEAPALEEAIVRDQMDILQAIKEEIDAVTPELEMVRQSADDLMRMCGDADKPEVEKNMDELQANWAALNNAYKDAHDALEESMHLGKQFQDGLNRMNDYIDVAEEQLDNMEPVGSDPVTVKRQLDDLRNFRREQDSKNLELEGVNNQGSKLLNRCTDDTRDLVQEPLNHMNRRWKDMAEKTFDRQHKLEAGLLALGQLEGSLDELLNWMDRTDSVLSNQKPLSGDPRMAEIELAKHKVLQNDIHSHQPTVDSINQAARNFVSSSDNKHAANAIRGKLDNLNGKWRNLLKKSDDRQHELEDVLGQSNTFQDEANRLMRWLGELDSQLSAAQPVGGLPETAREQLDKHKDLARQLDREQMAYDRLMESGRQLRRNSGPEADREGGVGHTMQQLQNQWEATRQKADDRKAKLDDAFKQAQSFHDDLQAFITWLTTAEKTLNAGKPPSTVLDNINKQIADHKEFLYGIADKKETMKELDKTGTQLKYFSQKQDVILIKNLLISVQNRWEKVQSRCQERSRQLDSGFKRAKQFKDNYDKLFKWLEDSEAALYQDRRVHSDPDALKDQLKRHKEFQRSLGAKQPMYDTIVRTGRSLREKSSPGDTKIMNGMLSDLKDKWDLVCGKSVDRQRKLEEALLYSGQFKDALQALLEWLYQVEPRLSEDNPVHGDIDTVMNMMEAHKGFQRDLGSRKGSVKSVNKSSKELKDKSSDNEDLSHLNAKVEELNAKWDNVCQLSVQKQEQLEGAMKEAEEFHEAVHMLLEWLADAEQGLRFHGPLSDDQEVLTEQLEAHKDFKKMFAAQESKLNDACQMGDNILSKCSPDAVTVVKHWITVLQARWEEVNNLSHQREERLSEALVNLKDNARLLEDLLKWLEGAENTIQGRDAKRVPDDIPVIQQLLEEHQSFEDEMAGRQPEIDKLTKAHKRRRSVDAGPSGIPMLERSRRGRHGKPRSREPSPGPDSSRNPRVSALNNKWKQVWLMAMDRRRRLQDALDKQAELKKLDDFKFDEWRDRYVRWMNHKKARVMDFFRKLDMDRDGKLSRREFIDGIIGSKFPTNQLEMNAVSDIFDSNHNGYIEYKEFIAALWPEKIRGTKPVTDAQKIDDEVRKQVHMCTCIKKFKIQRVGESKYRFGESQQLRLVRILRSTVMVRVGGGWMALDEFLVKNDPCRAKGRTNIELRERFILADGVSQSMASFGRPRRSRSPSESSTGSASSKMSLTAPILKIKEKKNIARPWQQSPRTTPNRRISTQSKTGTDGSVTSRTKREDANGSTTTRRVTSGLAPGRTNDRAKSPIHTNGASTSTKVLGQHTTVDYGDKKHGRGTGGEVTVRTVTEEERTITGPTRKHITMTKTPAKKAPSPRSSTTTTPRMSSLSTPRSGSSSTSPRTPTPRSSTTTPRSSTSTPSPRSSTTKSTTPRSGWR